MTPIFIYRFCLLHMLVVIDASVLIHHLAHSYSHSLRQSGILDVEHTAHQKERIVSFRSHNSKEQDKGFECRTIMGLRFITPYKDMHIFVNLSLFFVTIEWF